MTVLPPVPDPSIKSGHASESDTSDDRVTAGRPPEPAQSTWGGLEILEEIGHGGFGRVYRAWEPTLAREVALKIIRPPGDQLAAASAILHEGRLLARVHHPNVVTIHGARQIGTEVGLWMEFVRGRTLADIVKDDGPRAAGEAALIGVTLCQALAAVHQTGVVHRDVKAHNVMREAGGRIVLMDFGAGELLTDPANRNAHPVGTPVYMAPEVLAGSSATAQSDIYSLGVLLYHLVTGSYPVEGRTWTDFLIAHARSERRALADVRPDLSVRFVHVVERATAASPHGRYATPGAMLRDLAETATGEHPTTTPHVIPRTDSDDSAASERPGISRVRRIAASVGAAVLTVGLLGALTSIWFNVVLGRAPRFNAETPLDWFAWGVRSLVGTVFSLVLLLVAIFLLRLCVRLLGALLPFVRRRAGGWRRKALAVTERSGLVHPDALAHAAVLIGLCALVVVCWRFEPLVSASITVLNDEPAARFEVLRPENVAGRVRYRRALEGVVLLIAVAAWATKRMQRRGQVLGWWPRVAMGVVASVAALLIVAPYRLMWDDAFERVDLDRTRCYIVGRDATDLLLHCPDLPPPRNRVVRADDTRLLRSGVVESIFTR